jgi:hypothetical protein
MHEPHRPLATGVETYLAKTALSVALDATKGHVARMREQRERLVDRCVAGILAAHEAVRGLTAEHAEILRDAVQLDIARPENQQLLLRRIDRYLREDELRPLLAQTAAGLKEIEAALKRQRRTVLERVWFLSRRRRRQEVLRRLSDHLDEVQRFLRELDADFDRRRYELPSGVGLDDLLQLERGLKQLPITGAPGVQKLRAEATSMREQRNTSEFITRAEEVGKLTVRLTQELAV